MYRPIDKNDFFFVKFQFSRTSTFITSKPFISTKSVEADKIEQKQMNKIVIWTIIAIRFRVYTINFIA